MKYEKRILLKDGRECLLRNGTRADGQEALAIFNLTHAQTDYLLSYPEESTLDAAQEGDYLQEKTDSQREIEILAIVENRVVGTAGIDAVGSQLKVRHRGEFGIAVDREFWGLGIGWALTQACIQCAREAGFAQLELTVVGDNHRAVEMYRRAGFVEFGRNPRGFRSKFTGYQELISMGLVLSE